MTQQVQMNASAIGGLIQTQFSGNQRVPASGVITVDSRDAAALLAAGANYVRKGAGSASFTAPIVGAVGQIVASTTLANGTLTIANDPDVGRQCSVRIATGTSTVTAGNVAFTYVANDGQATVDNFSAIGVGTTILSTNTSKGVLVPTSVIATGLVGATSTTKIQIDTLNALACPVDPGFSSFALTFASEDGTYNGGATADSAGCVTPSTAPNGTHNYVFGFTFTSPLA